VAYCPLIGPIDVPLHRGKENGSGSAEDDIQKQDHASDIAQIKGGILAAAPTEGM
jgi:hypothetical protein